MSKFQKISKAIIIYVESIFTLGLLGGFENDAVNFPNMIIFFLASVTITNALIKLIDLINYEVVKHFIIKE